MVGSLCKPYHFYLGAWVVAERSWELSRLLNSMRAVGRREQRELAETVVESSGARARRLERLPAREEHARRRSGPCARRRSWPGSCPRRFGDVADELVPGGCSAARTGGAASTAARAASASRPWTARRCASDDGTDFDPGSRTGHSRSTCLCAGDRETSPISEAMTCPERMRRYRGSCAAASRGRSRPRRRRAARAETVRHAR